VQTISILDARQASAEQKLNNLEVLMQRMLYVS
jgi:hypothetical protein